MTERIRDVLTQLIEITPLPPSETEVEPLLTAFEEIIARRAELLDQLGGPLQLSDAERPLVREIERRDAAWQHALTVALETVAGQRRGTDQLRAYARTV